MWPKYKHDIIYIYTVHTLEDQVEACVFSIQSKHVGVF